MAITVGDALLRMGVNKDQFERDIDGAQKLVKDRMQKMQDGLKIAGAAFTALGAAGLKLAADARKLNADLATTGLTLGATVGEMRDLALATTNVTFPLESVAATFDILARAGVKTKDEMQAAATAFDTLADATGSSAEEVAGILIPAFKAFGEELPLTVGELDKFTWLAKTTTVNLSDFGGILAYLAPEMDNLGVSMDDTIAIMAALEAKGLTGSAATRVFRTAVTEAATGEVTLSEALGLTSAEVDIQRTAMEAATGITDEYAAAANEQYGVMDKLKQSFSEMTLRVGSMLTPFEPLLGVMTAAGPAMMFLGTSTGTATVKFIANTTAMIAQKVAMVASKVAMVAATAAQWLFNAAMTANPIGIVIAALAALGAAIFVIVKNWDTIREKTVEVWNTIVDFVKMIFGKIVGFVKDHWDKMLAILFPAVGLPLLIFRHWGQIVDVVKTMWNAVVAFLVGIWARITDLIKTTWDNIASFFSGVWQTILGVFRRHWDMILAVIFPVVGIPVLIARNWGAIVDVVKDIWNKVIGVFGKIQDRIANVMNPVKDVILAPIRGALRLVGDAINWLIRQLNKVSFSLPSWIPGIGGKTFGINIQPISLPAFEKGGVINEPTMLYGLRSMRPYGVAGEAGREFVVPEGAGGGYRTANIYFQMDGRTMVRMLGQPLVDEIRLRQAVRA